MAIPNFARITQSAIIFVGTLLVGCANLNGAVPFRYVPSLPTIEQSPYRLGMQKLTDVRPTEDREATEAIPDVDEKVSAKLLEDLRASRMFADVDFPASKAKDDLILKGEVKRFYWQLTTNPIAFIPIINLAIYFGADVYDLEGIATLHVQIVDPKTDQVIGNYERTSQRNASASIYHMKGGELGAELADAFRDVAKRIKENIAADLQSGQLKPT